MKFIYVFIFTLILSLNVYSEDQLEVSVSGDDNVTQTDTVDRSKKLQFEGIKVEGVQTAPLEYTKQQLEDKNSKNRLLRIPANFQEKSKKDISDQRYMP